MKNDIEINHLNFNYDNTVVLEDINLIYNRSEFLAIIGPNGGGKSTLLKIMIGLLEPTSGEVQLFGQKPCSLSHEIAYVPQDTLGNKSFPIRVLDVVLMGRLSLKNTLSSYSQNDYDIAYAALEKVGMKGFEKQKISHLSGGQRQRVYIARALACEAKIIFLDEPTASIDTAGQIDIFNLLKSLNKNIGIIIISHDVNVALKYATKAIHINKTLHAHDLPKVQNLKLFETRTEHICPVDIISATSCNHFHKGKKC